jgi:hypothetical protein
MSDSMRDFAPYFRNGLLYLPQRTVDMLIMAGLDAEIGKAALHGLALDDHKTEIAQINRTLEQLLGNMEEDTQAFQTLSSDDTHFMLTGKSGSL